MRTDVTKVKSIMSTALEDAEILALAGIANTIVTRVLDGEGLTEALLINIETYFTAHLIAIGKERQLKSEKVGDMWITYQGKFGEMLKSTTYGQMVLMLDSSGEMGRSTKEKAQIRAIPQFPDDHD